MSDSSPASTSGRPASRWHIFTALTNWVLPGVGYLILGQRTRGLIVGGTIICLWLSGLLLGGIGVIDQHRNPAWFLGQSLIAPSLAVYYYHQQLEQRYTLANGPQPPQVGEPGPAYEPTYGRMAEIGTLYTTLAGLLNLLLMIDVIYRDPAPRLGAGGGVA